MMTPARVPNGRRCWPASASAPSAEALRTGRGSAGGTHRYYTCSAQGAAGQDRLRGRTIPMDRLDHLVADHIEDRLLQPKRLETIFASVIDRREERTERRREHLAELHRRITDADQRLGRLYEAIESSMIDKDDEVFKEHIAGLKALRDQAKADAERTTANRRADNSRLMRAEIPSIIDATAGGWIAHFSSAGPNQPP